MAAIDKAAIFADITRRNALRKSNGLPLLNVPEEYAHEASVAAQREFWTTYEQHAEDHAAEREAIRQQVLMECRATRGAEFCETMAGRWTIRVMTQRRFEGYIASKYGLPTPERTASRHPVTYGAGRADRA